MNSSNLTLKSIVENQEILIAGDGNTQIRGLDLFDCYYFYKYDVMINTKPKKEGICILMEPFSPSRVYVYSSEKSTWLPLVNHQDIDNVYRKSISNSKDYTTEVLNKLSLDVNDSLTEVIRTTNKRIDTYSNWVKLLLLVNALLFIFTFIYVIGI